MMRERAVELNEWAAELRGTLPHSVLLGMGGSSLVPRGAAAHVSRRPARRHRHHLSRRRPCGRAHRCAVPGRIQVGRDARDALARGVLLGAHRRRSDPVCGDHRPRHRSWQHRPRARVPARVREPARHRRPLLRAVVLRHGGGGARGHRRRGAPGHDRARRPGRADLRRRGARARRSAVSAARAATRSRSWPRAVSRASACGPSSCWPSRRARRARASCPSPERPSAIRTATATTACSCICAATARTTGRCTTWPRPAIRC